MYHTSTVLLPSFTVKVIVLCFFGNNRQLCDLPVRCERPPEVSHWREAYNLFGTHKSPPPPLMNGGDITSIVP